jgi:small subunit ribosomal protein S11
MSKVRRSMRAPLRCIVHVHTSLNNTIVSLASLDGDVLAWASSGSLGFRGSRGSTGYAAQAAAESLSRRAVQRGVRLVEVRLRGMGYGKEYALRGLSTGGLKIHRLVDTTLVPHNGCRAPKRRRV